MTEAPNRRKFLRTTMGAASVILSGCGGADRQTDTIPESTGTAETTGEGPSTQTEMGVHTTSAENSWDADPLQHHKLIGAHYYPWYRKTDEWTANTPGHPVLGNYHSANPDVINQHIKWAVEHGINWFSASWRGRNNFRDNNLRNRVFEAELADQLDISILYESKGRFLPEEGNIYNQDFDNEINHRILRDDFRYLEEEYFGRSNYLRIDDKPVVFVYSAQSFIGDVKTAFQGAKAVIDTEVYLIADVLNGFTHAGAPNVLYKDWIVEFDALSLYNIFGVYRKNIDHISGFDEFIRLAEEKLFNWYLQADNEGMDFIPNLLPGFNNTEWTVTAGTPVLERSPEDFRSFSQSVMRHLDPRLDAALITSFNEWPEYTAIEPAEEYGRTYLQITKAELTQGNPRYIDLNRFDVLQIDFNKTVKPSNIEWGADDDVRDLALLLGMLEFQSSGGDTIEMFDVGVPNEEPILLKGAYGPEQSEKYEPWDTWRWLGGPSTQSTVYVEIGNEITDKAILSSRPITEGAGIEADIFWNGHQTDHLAFDEFIHDYEISLQA